MTGPGSHLYQHPVCLPALKSYTADMACLKALRRVQPDWDMFQSKHPAAKAHAAARAVSGAAVYVSDYPGQHDFGLLKQLVLPDGSVLRARLPGRPTADCLFTDVLRDGKSLLKVPSFFSALSLGMLTSLVVDMAQTAETMLRREVFIERILHVIVSS